MNLYDYIQLQDHILTFPWMGTTAVRATGFRVYEIYESPEKQLESAILMDQLFDADFVYPLDDGIVLEEAVGAIFSKPDNQFPDGGAPLVWDFDSLRQLTIPDPYTNIRMHTNIQSYQCIAHHFDKPLAVSVPGPVTLAASLMDLESFLRATIRKPDLINELLVFTTETVKCYCQAIVNAGVKLLCISEPYASLLSPIKYVELCSKNVRKVWEGLNCFTVFHPCGNSTKYVDCLLETGAQGFSLDQVVDLKTLEKEFPEHCVLMGNLDPVNILRNMSKEDVRKETLHLLDEMNSFPNYMFSFGCDCTPDTPFENMQIAISTAKQYVKKV